MQKIIIGLHHIEKHFFLLHKMIALKKKNVQPSASFPAGKGGHTPCIHFYSLHYLAEGMPFSISLQ